MQITENAPIEVSVYRSTIDGALVVEIDTEAETGNVRVNLNDSPIWEGDPESTTSARELLIQIEKLRTKTHKVSLDKRPAELDTQFREGVERILLDAHVRQWERS